MKVPGLGPSSQVQRAVLPGRERKVPGPGSAAEHLGEPLGGRRLPPAKQRELAAAESGTLPDKAQPMHTLAEAPAAGALGAGRACSDALGDAGRALGERAGRRTGVVVPSHGYAG